MLLTVLPNIFYQKDWYYTDWKSYNVVKNLTNTEFVTGEEIMLFKPSAILPQTKSIFSKPDRAGQYQLIHSQYSLE